MPVLKWVNEGENRVLGILLGATPPDGGWYLGLYKNLVEPGEDIVLPAFEEPSGYGYARKLLTRGQWTIVDDLASYAQQTFLASGGDWGDITGYFLATSSNNSGKALAICHFDTALTVLNGKGIKVIPKIRCG